MFKWLKKGANEKQELDAARARVEAAQRALVPLTAGLSDELAAQVRAAEALWKEACAAEAHGAAESRAQALSGFARSAETLAAVRARVLAERPELVQQDLVARAEQALVAIEDAPERAEAELRVLRARLMFLGGAGMEETAPRTLEWIEAASDPMLAVALVEMLLARAARLGETEWARSLRARAIAFVSAFEAEEFERGNFLHALLEAQAGWGDLAGTRATLAELTGEYREQGLLALAEAEARAGEFEAARATLAAIEGAALRRDGEVTLVNALAHKVGPAEALVAARALDDEAARSAALVKVVGARARAGEQAEALALLSEIEPDGHEEARLAIFEEALERGDLAAAEQMAALFERDESREIGGGRLAETRAQRGDFEGALADARAIQNPLRQAYALEHVAWERKAAGDEEGARAAFGLVLDLASEVVRHGGGVRSSGGVEHAWLVLAARIQATLGDPESAGMSVERFQEPAERREGWTHLGWGCARMGNLAGVDELCARTASPFDRIWILCGAADGLRYAKAKS